MFWDSIEIWDLLSSACWKISCCFIPFGLYIHKISTNPYIFHLFQREYWQISYEKPWDGRPKGRLEVPLKPIWDGACFVARKPIDLPFCLIDTDLSSTPSFFDWYTTSLVSCSKAKSVIPAYTLNSNGQERKAYKSGFWLPHCQHVFGEPGHAAAQHAGQTIPTIRTLVCLSWSYIVTLEPLSALNYGKNWHQHWFLQRLDKTTSLPLVRKKWYVFLVLGRVKGLKKFWDLAILEQVTICVPLITPPGWTVFVALLTPSCT